MPGLSRDAVLIRQLQGKLGLAGTISSAGAVVRGEGFTSVRNALGNYTVTFSPAFADVPVVTFGGTTASELRHTAVSASSMTVNTFNSAGGLIDSEFDFIARPAS